MGMQLWDAVINALFLIVLLMCLGRVLDAGIQLLYNFMIAIIGSRAAYLLYNLVLFVGVVHHELSHALLAFITGAKVTQVNLYKWDKNNNTLGSVSFIPRGPVMLQSIQLCLSAIAPVLMGFVSVTGMFIYYSVHGVSGYYLILFWYVFISILCHMRLSLQDIKMAIKGLPMCYVLLVIIFYTFNFDLITYVRGLM